MITLAARNVLLKPSHRRQLMAWLKRSVRLGRRLGNFALTITIRRSGQCYEARADVRAVAGDFTCRTRGRDVLPACRDLAHTLSRLLHQQRLQLTGG